MANDELVLERLDRLIALYELVNGDQLMVARELALAEPVTGFLIKEAEEWTTAGALKSSVATKAGTSEKTVQRRIQELVGKKALLARKDGTNISYKSSGLYE